MKPPSPWRLKHSLHYPYVRETNPSLPRHPAKLKLNKTPQRSRCLARQPCSCYAGVELLVSRLQTTPFSSLELLWYRRFTISRPTRSLSLSQHSLLLVRAHMHATPTSRISISSPNRLYRLKVHADRRVQFCVGFTLVHPFPGEPVHQPHDAPAVVSVREDGLRGRDPAAVPHLVHDRQRHHHVVLRDADPRGAVRYPHPSPHTLRSTRAQLLRGA